MCVRALADVYMQQGDLPQAARDIPCRLCGLYCKSEDPLGQMSCRLSISDLDRFAGDAPQAQQEFLDLLDLSHAHGISMEAILQHQRWGVRDPLGIPVRGQTDILKARVIYQKAGRIVPEEIEDRQARDQRVRQTYKRAILALQNDKGEVTGTGFLVLVDDKVFAITCSHALRDLISGKESYIRVQRFDGSTFTARAIWSLPGEGPPQHWTAKQDVSILEIAAPVPRADCLMLSADEYLGINNMQGVGVSRMFSRRPKGAWIEGVSCSREVGQEYIELAVSEESKVQIEQGPSGSPLCTTRENKGKILGTVQSYYGRQVAYLIPAW